MNEFKPFSLQATVHLSRLLVLHQSYRYQRKSYTLQEALEQLNRSIKVDVVIGQISQPFSDTEKDIVYPFLRTLQVRTLYIRAMQMRNEQIETILKELADVFNPFQELKFHEPLDSKSIDLYLNFISKFPGVHALEINTSNEEGKKQLLRFLLHKPNNATKFITNYSKQTHFVLKNPKSNTFFPYLSSLTLQYKHQTVESSVSSIVLLRNAQVLQSLAHLFITFPHPDITFAVGVLFQLHLLLLDLNYNVQLSVAINTPPYQIASLLLNNLFLRSEVSKKTISCDVCSFPFLRKLVPAKRLLNFKQVVWKINYSSLVFTPAEE
eukprot:snap_masked-scaffold_10-processed-gene-10.30-mRNA-1 protein AED:1.00 eAED:1.00 QI:0/-1/0/0/-1/1/1/0/322